MKKISLSLIMIIVMLVSVLSPIVYAETDDLYYETYIPMYSYDGRNIIVHESEVEAHLDVGWYLEPFITMYSYDGRTQRVPESEVYANMAVGWYLEPFITMYSYDGRTQRVPESEMYANMAVGWYLEPFITMYSYDGRTQRVPESEMYANMAVGWYLEPFVTMYAPDGRTQRVLESEVAESQAVGWYTYPVTTVYAKDGRSAIISVDDVKAWCNVGWYTYKPELKLPFSGYEEFVFTSGAGGWRTLLTVYPDGSFYGNFSDSDMGDTGYGYPGGTVYICDFKGKFGNIKVIDEYSYSMTLETITWNNPLGTEWISNGVLYVASEPYGLEDGKNYIFYKKNTPAYQFTDEFKSWWGDWRWNYNHPKPTALNGFAIYNVKCGYAFIN